MKKLVLQENWPASWKSSYPYDLLEIYGERSHRGYAYSYANRRENTLALIQQVAPPGAKVLDVAAAQGNFTLSLAELGYEVTWNDLRAELAEYVELKRERGIVHYAPGNVFSLGLEGTFDVVLITEVIEHVAHPDQFLQKAGSLVKPGGHVVMSTPNGEYFLNRLPKFSDCPDPSLYEAVQFKPNADGHIFLLHYDEIAPLAAKAGLSVQEVRLVTNPLTFGHIKTELLLKMMPWSTARRIEKLTGQLPLGLRRKLHACFVVLFQRGKELPEMNKSGLV